MKNNKRNTPDQSVVGSNEVVTATTEAPTNILEEAAVTASHSRAILEKLTPNGPVVNNPVTVEDLIGKKDESTEVTSPGVANEGEQAGVAQVDPPQPIPASVVQMVSAPTPTPPPQVVIQVMSPIAWAKKHGKAAQMVYGWLRENKIPKDCIHVDPTTQRQFLVETAMDAWYAARQASKTVSTHHVPAQQNPLEILSLMIGWFKAANNDDIADSLQEVLASKQAEEPQLVTESTLEANKDVK